MANNKFPTREFHLEKGEHKEVAADKAVDGLVSSSQGVPSFIMKLETKNNKKIIRVIKLTWDGYGYQNRSRLQRMPQHCISKLLTLSCLVMNLDIMFCFLPFATGEGDIKNDTVMI